MPSLLAPPRYLDIAFPKNGETVSLEALHQTFKFPFAKSELFLALIKDAKVLSNDKEKKIIKITFGIDENIGEYIPGGTVGILPENSLAEIMYVAKTTNVQHLMNKPCQIILIQGTTKKGAKIPTHIPQGSPIATVLKKYIDLRSIPKKLFLRALADYTEDKTEQIFLQTLSSQEGASVYTQLILNNGITFIDILKLCQSCRPPFGLLLEHLPKLLPRPYSISNSPLKDKNNVKIVFSVHKMNPGLTTNMLHMLATEFIENPEKKLGVNMYLRQNNSFNYTKDDFSKDIIMIGVGCAISPFIGFMEHKSLLLKEYHSERSGIAWLFMGFKHPDLVIYKDDIKRFVQNGVITEVFESFSRYKSRFKYVQDQIKVNAERFVDFILKPDSIIYICADGADISRSIEETITACVAKVTNSDHAQAQETIRDLRKFGRYREDIW